jgi:signal transduction histidine kinase
VLLLALTSVLSVFAIYEVLSIRLQDRVNDSLQQEVLELDRLLADGRDPQTGRPFESLASVFDIYFSRNVPGSHEGMVAFLEGDVYATELIRYPLPNLPEDVISNWAGFSSPELGDDAPSTGAFDTALGLAHYRAAPITFNGEHGAFVVTILPQGEAASIRTMQTYGLAASLGVVLIASLFAWLFVGRVLAPVKQLTETARSISEADLSRRIEVVGNDEAAQMARSFNSMLDRLEAVFQSQREFVEDASHELRDPLTICRGHLELLPEDPVERKEAIEIVLDELDRMSRIVNDLRLLAEADQPDFLQLETLDVGLLAQELLAKVNTLADRVWRLDDIAHGLVLADRHRLTEAVMNLASNAAQHTGSDDTIAIGTSLTDEDARIWVRDTGSGISVADQERIFQRFSRGRGAHRRSRGAGLGLAIVKAVAHAHNGYVELRSRYGEGSTFTIVLPRTGPEGGAVATRTDR